MCIATSLYLFFTSALGVSPVYTSLSSIGSGWVISLAFFANQNTMFPITSYFFLIGLDLSLMEIMFFVARPISMNTKVVKTVAVTFMVVQFANLLIENWLMLQHPLVIA